MPAGAPNDSPNADASAESAHKEGLTAESNLSPWSHRRILAASLCVALGYYGAAKLGAVFQFPSAPVSALWAPNAILMAAFLVTPRRHWWVYLAMLIPAHVLAQIFDTAFSQLVIQYFANCGLALLGAAALLRLDGPPWRFDRLREVTHLILWAGVAAPLVTSLFMAAAFIAFHIGGNFWLTVVVRTLTNTFATLALVPLIVHVPRLQRVRDGSWWRQPRVLETLVLAALLIAIGTLVFIVPLVPP